MMMARHRTPTVDSSRASITSDDSRRACLECLLDRSFDTVPPISYGAWAHNAMNGFVRKSVGGEPGHFTVVFQYWSSSDTYRRVDLHFSADGAVIRPNFNRFFGPQPYHFNDCLSTLNLVAEGTLPVKDYNQKPIEPSWKSPVD